MKIVFHFFLLASSKEIIESCVFCSKMDVEFSPPFVSFDLHKKDPAGFQGRHSAEFFFFFHFRINLSFVLDIADTKMKKRLLNLTEEKSICQGSIFKGAPSLG